MWVLFAFASAVLEANSSLLRKKLTSQQKAYHLLPILVIASSWPVMTVIALPDMLHIRFGITLHTFVFLLLSIALNCIAVIFRYKALRLGDVSLLEPLTMLVPVLILVSGWIFLNESPSIPGVLGTLLVAWGALYINNAFQITKKIFTHKNIGTANRLMLVVACIWSVTTLLDKYVAVRIGIYAYIWLLDTGILFALLVFYRPKLSQLQSIFSTQKLSIGLIGLCGIFAMALQTKAISLTNTSYAIAVKRIDVLILIVLSSLFLKEKGGSRRFVGAFVMLIGIVCISVLT